MTITTTIKLNKDRKLLSGCYPVVIQIVANNKRSLIYTGVRIFENEFDDKKGSVIFQDASIRKKYEIRELNKKIKGALNIVDSIVNDYKIKKIFLSSKNISEEYRIRTSKNTLFSLFESAIREKKSQSKIGVARAYESTYRKVRFLLGGCDMSVSSIKASHINQLYEDMMNSNLSINSVCFYMRNLRAILNKYRPQFGNKSRLSQNLFSGIVLRKEKTIKRALTVEEMKLLLNMDISDKNLLFAKNLFLFCFMLRGAALADIFFMKNESFQKGYIKYRRHKTSVPMVVTLTPEMSSFIEENSSKDISSPYLFFFLDGCRNPEETYTTYRSALRKQNRFLKIIGEKAGLSTPLTSYVARHTWATQAKSLGASLEHISEAMGHTSQRTTAIYLKSFTQEILDDINNKVISSYYSLIKCNSY